MPVLTPAFDPTALLRLDIPPKREAVAPQAAILYALAVGLVQEADDPWSLPFVYEKGLRALPTMATVLGRPDGWMAWPELRPLKQAMLHGAQRLVMHRPLPVGGAVVARHRIAELVDKGEGRGALLIVERTLSDAATDAPVATMHWTVHCRGAGGFGGPTEPTLAQTPPAPGRAPDRTLVKGTRADAALLYRLTGDLNPIHADPEAARAAGLERPLLHGLQLFGLVAAETLRQGGHDPDRLALADLRFSSPVYPGETVEIDLWEQPAGYAVRVRCPEREAVVAERGLIELR